MKSQQTIQCGGVLAGAVALLLISGAFGSWAWAISGGEPDEGRHPNVCAVIAEHPVYGLLPFSGTLIHPRVVLTAGHAVAWIQAGEAVLHGVSFDQEADVTDPSTWLQVSDLFCSYDMSGGSPNSSETSASPNASDFALLVLQEPVPGIIPAALPSVGYLDDLKRAGQLRHGPDGTRFTVVGYGYGLDWPPPEPVYPISEDGKVARNVAQSGYLGLNDAWLFLTQNLAAGYGGIQLGDSGGPAFWTDPDTGDEILVSVTSYGDPPGVAHSGYCRMDTVESLEFIWDVIDSLEE